VDPATAGNFRQPHAFAVVYLPLHRTQALVVTDPTLTFGFRAASVDSDAETSRMAKLADLDLMQARRHAAFLTRYKLADDLTALQNVARGDVLRGVATVAEEWADRHARPRGRAAMFDCGLDFLGTASLEQAYEHSEVSSPTARCSAQGNTPADGEHAVAAAVERAGHSLGQRSASRPLHVGRNVADRSAYGRQCVGLFPEETHRPRNVRARLQTWVTPGVARPMVHGALNACQR
jgi:hypothetical protein